MKKNIGGAGMTGIALILGLIGLILRGAQLDSGKPLALILTSGIVCAAALALSFTLKQRRKYTDVFTPCLADLVLFTLGCVLLLMGCAFGALQKQGIARYVDLAGCAAVLPQVWALLLRTRKQPVPAYLYVPLTVYYVARLFVNFRGWTVDPMILDYCFLLFSSICYMIASYLAGAFCFDRGDRRLLLVFSIAGVFFGGVSLQEADLPLVLWNLGSMVLLLGNIWQVSKPKLRRRREQADD